MKKFFNVGLRLFKTSWLFSSLNLLGICIGITGIILLYIFIDSENSFDKFHKDYAQIYRLTSIFNQDGKENRFALNDGLWDEVLVTDVPGVAYSTASSRGGSSRFSADGKNFHLSYNNRPSTRIRGFDAIDFSRDEEGVDFFDLTPRTRNDNYFFTNFIMLFGCRSVFNSTISMPDGSELISNLFSP